MRNGDKGFTLIEVLVALTVTAITLSIVYGIFARISSTKERLESDGEGFHQARVLFSRLSREIRSAYYLPANPETIFRGGEDENRRFFIELTTTVGSPTLPQATGISKVRYELQDDPENASALPVLVRQEESLLPGTEAGGQTNRLSSGIHLFRLRFFDGSSWQEEWDTASGQELPEIVEIELEIEVEGSRLPFMTAVEVSGIVAP